MLGISANSLIRQARSASTSAWMHAPVPSKPDQGGAASFRTTHWSVVLAAQGESEGAHQALEKLCRTYWKPIYSFVRREGRRIEDAQDLTQGFFASLLERRDFNSVRREKGRLRSYLLVALKHFLASDHTRAIAVKRGGGQSLVPIEQLSSHERSYPEPADDLTADRIYERRWALTVLDQVITRLAGEYETAGNEGLFIRFKQLLLDDDDRVSQAAIASELGMNENAIKQAYHRFRRRYREVLREEIAHTVAVPGEVEEELRHLIAVLRA